MPAYFIADITIHDPDGYKSYLEGFMDIFNRHGGKLHVVSSAEVHRIEGDWAPQSIVLMAFPTLAAALAWKDDPDYVALARIRQATATTHLVLVEGLPTDPA